MPPVYGCFWHFKQWQCHSVLCHCDNTLFFRFYCDLALSVVCPSSTVCSSLILGHRSRRLQWLIVITRCPASVIRRPLDNLHFRLLLQNRLMDFDETWYGGSTKGSFQVLLFFGQIRPGADPGQGQNKSRGIPFLKSFFFRLGGYSIKPNA